MGKLTATKQELETLSKTMNCEQIGQRYGCSAELVRRALHSFDIPVSRRSFDPSAQDLSDLYQTMSMKSIADHYGVGETVVFKRLKEHGIALKEFGNHRLKTGRSFTQEHRQNLSKAHKGKWSGEKNPNWKGGVHTENLAARATGEYKQWRLAALAMKSDACESCGVKQGHVCECCGVTIRLHVHHVKSFSKHKDARFDPANAEVLCPKCHFARHH